MHHHRLNNSHQQIRPMLDTTFQFSKQFNKTATFIPVISCPIRQRTISQSIRSFICTCCCDLAVEHAKVIKQGLSTSVWPLYNCGVTSACWVLSGKMSHEFAHPEMCELFPRCQHVARKYQTIRDHRRHSRSLLISEMACNYCNLCGHCSSL